MATDLHPHDDPESPQSTGDAPQSSSWANGVIDLLCARLALIGLEARQAAALGAGRAAMILAAALLGGAAWLLAITSLAGILHAFAGFPWYWACLAIAAVHLLAASILLHIARKPGPPAFRHTKSEFQKDREWLQNLKTPKSKP